MLTEKTLVSMIKYNNLLDDLFSEWEKTYSKEDQEKFCRDGLMLKEDNSIDVDKEWEKSTRKIMFLLKDCPDGWGYDTRDSMQKMIGEKCNQQNANAIINLKINFYRNLAKIFYGLMECGPTNLINDRYVESKLDSVKKMWNEIPFAFVESKKIAGGKSVSEKSLRNALYRDEKLFKEEFDILSPNIIVCCDGSGTNAIFEFVTNSYFKSKPEKFGGQYILEDGSIVPNFKTRLWYYSENNVIVIDSYHPSARKGWKMLEKVLCPYRAFMQSVYATRFLK